MAKSETEYRVIRPPQMVPWKNEAELDKCLTARFGPERLLTADETVYVVARLLQEYAERPWPR